MNTLKPWGGVHANKPSKVTRPKTQDEITGAMSQRPALAFGNGRSYGDLACNQAGSLVDMRDLNRAMEIDEVNGTATFEAGALLGDIMKTIAPRGWVLPTTPGTQFVTLGGAIANDVHGKNHHSAGSFGCHVLAFGLYRSDGSYTQCSLNENTSLFKATIGGLGLTGIIAWARIRLKRTKSTLLEVSSRRFANLEEYFRLVSESQAYESTVAWVDCSAKGAELGRGSFQRANHVDKATNGASGKSFAASVFLTPPVSLVNRLSVAVVNKIKYACTPKDWVTKLQSYQAFHWPLDGIRDWNRLYGPRGFYQFQCVIPNKHAEHGLRRLLETIQRSGKGSFLVVLKSFGETRSAGLLSFPRPGITLAIDFANQGQTTVTLFRELERIVLEYGGALYPAKDALMSKEALQQLSSHWDAFHAARDPGISSDFARRLQMVS